MPDYCQSWLRVYRAERSLGQHRIDLSRRARNASVAGPIFGAWTCRTNSPAQEFGYAVMNLGLASGGSIIHTEMMQGFRPSGATIEQLTSNF